MLQVNYLKAHKEEVLQRLRLKNFRELSLVDEIITADDERKKLQFELDETQSKINAASKEIGRSMASGNKEAAEALKTEVAQ